VRASITIEQLKYERSSKRKRDEKSMTAAARHRRRRRRNVFDDVPDGSVELFANEWLHLAEKAA